MTSLLQKQLYVDFPGYLPSCQNEDPQNPRGLSKTSKEMTHAGFATMKADVLNGIQIVRKYLENLAKQTDSKEGSKQTLERLAKVEAGVKGWPGSGPSNEQRAVFVSGLRDLHEFVGKVEIADKYRDKLTTLVDQVGPFSLSGKNCKAPLMLFGVAP